MTLKLTWEFEEWAYDSILGMQPICSGQRNHRSWIICWLGIWNTICCWHWGVQKSWDGASHPGSWIKVKLSDHYARPGEARWKHTYEEFGLSFAWISNHSRQPESKATNISVSFRHSFFRLQLLCGCQQVRNWRLKGKVSLGVRIKKRETYDSICFK